ncbi:MAG: cupin-like domain-containing protein [Gammaproteobacteria bacterium]
MSTVNHRLVHVPPEKRALDVEQNVLAFRHELQSSALFSDAALAKLIDEHPHEDLHVHTMSGTNESPNYLDADVGSLGGADVLAAIKRGRIWLSVVHVEEHAAYRELLDRLYEELEAQSSIRTGKRPRLANLLISSPTAEVFYHADAQPNVLWHIRGRKQLIVYPPWDARFMSAENRELCLLGMLMDDVYRPENERYATTFDMGPGDVVTWPQSTPHRVVNVEGLNVSISSEHHTAASKRRQRVAAANWFFRNRFGLPMRTLQGDGAVAALKRGAYLACKAVGRVFGGGSLVPTDEDPTATIRLDPHDPRGYVEIAGR